MARLALALTIVGGCSGRTSRHDGPSLDADASTLHAADGASPDAREPATAERRDVAAPIDVHVASDAATDDADVHVASDAATDDADVHVASDAATDDTDVREPDALPEMSAPEGGIVLVDGADSDDAGLSPAPSSIVLVPGPSGIPIGSTTILRVIALYADRTEADFSDQATYTSNNANVVSVVGKVAKAEGRGTATITASFGGLTSTRKFTIVGPVTTTSVRVSGPAECAVGESVRFDAVATLSNGVPRDIRTLAAWASSNPNAEVASSGEVRCRALGAVTISATDGGVRGEAALVVVTPKRVEYSIAGPAVVRTGDAAEFSLRVAYDGRPSRLVPAAWETSDAAILPMIDGTSSQFRGATRGYAKVTAKVEGSALASLDVGITSGDLLSLAIAPDRLDLVAPSMGALTARGTYSDGIVGDISSVVYWSVDAPVVAIIDGQLKPTMVGTARVAARSADGVTSLATAQVTVAPGQPASLQRADHIVAAVGIERAVAMYAQYADGTLVDVTAAVTWNVADPNVATCIRATCVGLKPGRTTYQAELGNRQSEPADITITNAVLSSIAFASPDLTLATGLDTPNGVIGTFDDGTQIDVTGAARFATGDPTIATISSGPAARGVVTAVGAGTTWMTAVVQGFSTTGSIMVTP